MKKLNRVLLIDDDEVTNMLNEIVIKDLDANSQVMTATNGAEALDFLKEACQHSSSANLPDIIFLDINMPIMNGFEFLEELAKVDELGEKSPSIILLTSSHSQRDIEESKKFNINWYINKPLTEEKLTELLARLP